MAVSIWSVGLATLAGVAAWLSMGTLALVDAATGARAGVLPPWWLLVACLAVSLGGVVARRLPPTFLMPLALTALLWLPWLPGRVPAAFLIWHGPLATLVWVLVAIGLAAPVVPLALRAVGASSPTRAPRLVLVLACVAFAGGAWAVRERMPAGDEPHYLVITQSLLHDNDLRIENQHTGGEYTRYFRAELPPDYLRRGLDGQIYSIHAPGISALVLPAFALGGYPLVVLALIALAACAARLLWSVCWRLTGDAAAAWVATLGVWGTTPMFFQAFAVFPDAAGAAITTVGLWALVRYTTGAPLPGAALAAVGTALALLPWLHTRFAVIAGLLGGALVLRLLATRQWRVVSMFLAVPLVSATTWFGYFWMIWGTVSPTAPYGGYTQSSVTHWLQGVPGLLLDQQFGLLTTAPVFLLACVGMVPLARRVPRLALEIGLLLVAYTLAVAAYRMWWGGYSTPARFLVAVLPLAAVPMAVGWRHLRAGGQAVAGVLLVVSLAGVVLRATTADGALLFNDRDGADLSLSWLNHLVSLPLALPSLHRDVPRTAVTDALIWLAVGACCTLVARHVTVRRGHAWTLAVAAMALTTMVASTLSWRRHGMERFTPAASAMALLRAWPSTVGAVGWQSRPFRVVDAEAVLPHLSVAGRGRAAVGDGRVALLTVPRVAPGDYEVVVTGSARLTGQIEARVGRDAQAVETWPLEPAASGVRRRLRLPVTVAALTLAADEATAAFVDQVQIRPVHPDAARLTSSAGALHAARYGTVRVFQMDEDAFLEPGGIWTRGGEATTLVIDARADDDGPWAQPFGLHLRAGAAPVNVTLGVGDWTTTRALQPGATEVVVLPASSTGVWPLRVRTDGGFRPVDHEPGSRDLRFLGMWISVVREVS